MLRERSEFTPEKSTTRGGEGGRSCCLRNRRKREREKEREREHEKGNSTSHSELQTENKEESTDAKVYANKLGNN